MSQECLEPRHEPEISRTKEMQTALLAINTRVVWQSMNGLCRPMYSYSLYKKTGTVNHPATIMT